jgi:hypothetical protein
MRHTLLLDSSAVVGAVGRGRASSRQPNRVMRTTLPHVGPTQMVIGPVWTRSADRAADDPPRGRLARRAGPREPGTLELIVAAGSRFSQAVTASRNWLKQWLAITNWIPEAACSRLKQTTQTERAADDSFEMNAEVIDVASGGASVEERAELVRLTGTTLPYQGLVCPYCLRMSARAKAGAPGYVARALQPAEESGETDAWITSDGQWTSLGGGRWRRQEDTPRLVDRPHLHEVMHLTRKGREERLELAPTLEPMPCLKERAHSKLPVPVLSSAAGRRPRFLEVFSGEGTLAKVATSFGFEVTTVDIRHGPEHDLLVQANQMWWLREVESGA